MINMDFEYIVLRVNRRARVNTCTNYTVCYSIEKNIKKLDTSLQNNRCMFLYIFTRAQNTVVTSLGLVERTKLVWFAAYARNTKLPRKVANSTAGRMPTWHTGRSIL